MIVIGIDGSKNGTGVVAAKIDDDSFIINEIDYISFTQTKKHETDKIKFHHKTGSFNDDQAKFCWIRKEISEFIINFVGIDGSPLYVAIEDYAHNSPGRQFDKGEICGMLKLLVYDDFKANLRKYSPKTIKKFAGSGNNDKTAMCEAYLESPNELGLTMELSALKPINDLIDAYWICKLLIKELELKYSYSPVNLTKKEKELFAINSKDSTKNYTTKQFESYHSNLIDLTPRSKNKS